MKSEKSENLRKKAEKTLQDRIVNLQDITAQDAQSLIHELQVHQNELEMQNEELRRAKTELEESHNKYSNLYDFAPIGYFTFDKNGLTIEVNLTGANILGRQRIFLIRTPFSIYISAGYRDVFYSHLNQVFSTGKKQTCEIKLVDKNKNQIDVRLESLAVRDSRDNSSQCRTAIIDIIELKRAEEKSHAFNQMTTQLKTVTASKADIEKEITERKLAEEALKEKEQRLLIYTNAIDQTKDAILTFGSDMTLRTWNKGAEMLFGWSAAEVLGKTTVFLEIEYSEYPPGTTREMIIAKAQKQNYWQGEVISKRKDGSKVTTLATSTVLRDDKGNIIGYVSTHHDITERKKAEEALRTSEERFRAFVMASSEVVYRMSPDWSEMRQLRGRDFLADTEKPSATWLQKYIHPDDQPHVTAVINEAIRTKSIFQLEHRVLRADGSLGWMFSRAVPLMDANGEIVEWFGAASDITERKQAEETQAQLLREIDEQRGHLQAIIDSLPTGLWVADATGKMVLINDIARRIYGGKAPYAGNVKEYEIYNAWWADTNEKITAEDMPMSHALKGETIKEIAVDFQRFDGTCGTQLVSASPIRDSKGTILGCIAIVQDITDLKQMEEALRESEKQYRSIIETANEGIILGDTDGKIKLVNKKMADMLGYPEEDIIGRVGLDFMPEDQKEKVLANRIKLANKNQIQDEFCFRRKDGSLLWTIGSTAPIFNNNGDNIGNLTMHTDITDRKRAEKALRKAHDELEIRVQERTAELQESNEALKAEIQERKLAERKLAEQAFMLANISDAVIGFDLDYRITYYSKSAEKMYGYSAEEVIGHTGLEVFKPSYLGITREEAIQKLKNIGNLVTEAIHTKKDGSKVIVESHAVLLYDNHGKPIGLMGISRDITERKKAEETLRQSEERFKALAETTPLGIGVSEIPDNNFLYVNASYEKAFGYEKGELLYKKAPDVYWDKKDREEILKILKKNGYVDNQEIRLKRKDGSMFWGIISVRPINFEGKTALLGAFNDITEHKRDEEKIREQATLLDKAQDAIIVRDLEHRITYWNKGAQRMYGWTADEAAGRNVIEFLYKDKNESPQIIEARKTVMEQGEWKGELGQITKDGKEIIVESHLTLIRDDKGLPKLVFAINTDITDKKRLELHLLRAQRMESIGTLAGGIAHDLNNMLTPMMISLNTLKQKYKDEQSQKLLTILEQNSQRSADLIKQVLSFSRGVEGERVPLQAKHLITEIEKIAKETFPRNIEIRTDIQKDLFTISGDATQLHQVIMNLCVNARDAMPDGGILSISAENFFIDENYVQMHIEAKVGSYVAITVSDTGIGIPSKILDRIFEPFFTTKEFGKGTGLGLSTALAIVKSHGGFINIYSEVGKGTKFRIYLPATLAEMQNVEEQQLELFTGHGELVLVAEDEDSVREVTISTLKEYGYNVLAANDGADAVALYAQNKDKIKVVLMDMMMPVMDGYASIKAIRKINPDVKVIVVSGLAEKDKLANIESTRAQAILPKPYTAERLLKTIHEVLSTK